MYMTITRRFLIPEFPFNCHPDPSKENELSNHIKTKVSVIFPTCHTLLYEDKPFPFPCPAVPVGVWCCLPPSCPWLSSLFPCSQLPCTSSRHHSSLCWTDLSTCKCQERRTTGRKSVWETALVGWRRGSHGEG